MMAGSTEIGVMQGRLGNKPGKPLQSFPWSCWREEFSRAASLGFDAIEWLLDGDRDFENPISSSEGRAEILETSSRFSVNVSTLCAHTFIKGDLLVEGRHGAKAVEHLNSVLECSQAVGIKMVILPAMDAMSLQPIQNRGRLHSILNEILSGPGPMLLLESDLSGPILEKFISAIGLPRLGVVYDLGNAHAFGFDIASDLNQLSSLIHEIHVKDRQGVNGPSCLLGEGGTPFATAVQALDELSWRGPLVLETPIFNNWKAAAEHNLSFTKRCWKTVESYV